MKGLHILSTASYLPDKIVTNTDFQSIVDTSHEWIVSRTGIKERRVATHESSWYMGAMAAKAALERKNISPESIDMVLYTSITPDFHTPSHACLVARKLGIPHPVATDLNVACTGFPFALDMARRYLITGDVKRVLIVSSESLSQLLDYTKRETCVLFGDGAAACIVEAKDSLYASYQGSSPMEGEHLYSHVPRVSHPWGDTQLTEESLPFPVEQKGLHMNGTEVYKFAINILPHVVEKVAEKAQISVADIQLIIPHQANIRIIEGARKRLKLPREKFFVNVEKYGNTSSASIPLALDEAISSQALQPGDLYCLVGFGAGLTYSGIIAQY